MLNSAEKDYIVNLIQNNEPIPEDFKYKLFPVANKEYELVYAGKMRKEDLLANQDGSTPVPLQVEKVFNGKSHPPFSDEWQNMIVFGDNLQFLKTIYKNEDPIIKNKLKGKIKLVYIDPPFATTNDFKNQDGAKAYTDKISGAEFIEFLRRRLILLHEIMADDGSIFVHLDWKKAHYIKTILDEVFGESNFVNEIVWHYSDNFQGNVKGFANNHNVIFWYTKSQAYTSNKILIPLPKETKKDIRIWDKELKKLVSKRDENGKIVYTTLKEKKADDVWDIGQSSTTKSHAREFIDYPTQKPEELVRRIILAASNEGDIVFDCFAGSGTTAATAEKLNRKWVICDIGKLSHFTSQKRLLEIQNSYDIVRTTNNKKIYGKQAKEFITCTLGTYDLASALNLEFDNYKNFVSELFDIELKQVSINGYLFDGEKNGSPVIIFNYKLHSNSNIDDTFLGDVFSQVGSRLSGDRIYIVSPSQRVDYLTDYEEIGNIRFYFLKIPYQIIKELHQTEFKKFRQPRSKAKVNTLDESIGFSFNRTPRVKSKIKCVGHEIRIEILDFNSEEPGSNRTKEEKGGSGLELLSAIFVDRDYNGKEFIMTDFWFSDDAMYENGILSVSLPDIDVGNKMMIVYTDIYGNDFTESIDIKEIKDART